MSESRFLELSGNLEGYDFMRSAFWEKLLWRFGMMLDGGQNLKKNSSFLPIYCFVCLFSIPETHPFLRISSDNLENWCLRVTKHVSNSLSAFQTIYLRLETPNLAVFAISDTRYQKWVIIYDSFFKLGTSFLTFCSLHSPLSGFSLPTLHLLYIQSAVTSSKWSQRKFS